MKKCLFVLCVIAALLLVALPSHAGMWFTDEATGCQAWDYAPMPRESNVLLAECKDGKATGAGVLQKFVKDSLMSTTDCEFRDGRCNGLGAVKWFNGDHREGEYVDGVFVEKKGVFNWTIGNRYEGEFVDGQRTGKGIFIWANGNRYSGDFVEGKRTGKGTFVWANGDRYEGDFVDNVIQGKGAFLWASGNRYVGDFVNDKFSGMGALTWTNGNRYEGDFSNGSRTGKGTFVWANGDRYEGDFVESCIQVAPEYPLSAESIRFTGQVKAVGRVVDGAVQSVRILFGPNVFHDAVRDALMQYKCPGVVGPLEFAQEFNFK